MFLGVEYEVDGKPVRVATGMVGKSLPVATRGGGFRLIPMGQGEPFVDQSPGLFQGWPPGDTVTLEMLAKPTGLWQKWRSRPVKIAVACFFGTNDLGYTRRHNLKPGEWLQGALLEKKSFERVYFVIVPQRGTTPSDNCWWPRVVSASSRKRQAFRTIAD